MFRNCSPIDDETELAGYPCQLTSASLRLPKKTSLWLSRRWPTVLNVSEIVRFFQKPVTNFLKLTFFLRIPTSVSLGKALPRTLK
jgi:hypothetical protein